MATAPIRMIRVIPGGDALRAVLADFAETPDGIVTAFEDSALTTVRDLLDPDAPVEIQPFGQIVRRITVSAGQEARSIAQEGLVEAAVGMACASVSDLGPFLRGSRHVGIHRGISRTLRLLAEWGVGQEEMPTVASQCNERLRAKLLALWRIDEHATKTLLALGREGMHDQMFRLDWNMNVELEGADTRMLVLLGGDDEPSKIDFLEWLSMQGAQITLVAERHPTNPGLFKTPANIAERLKIVPRDIGEGTILHRSLFSDEATSPIGLRVRLVCAADPLAESEWALRECAGKNAAIFARDLHQYGPLLQAAAERLEIPIVATRRVELLSNAFVRISLAAIEFCASDDVRTLIDVLPSSYLNLRAAQQTELRSMLYEARKHRLRQWEVLHEAVDERSTEFGWLKFLLDWRQRAMQNTRDLRAWNDMLKELVESEELPWTEKVASGSATMLDRDVFARNQMQRTVVQNISVALLSEASSVSFVAFIRWLRPLLESAEFTLPRSSGGIVVTTDPLALSSHDEVYVLGMLEGTFPRRRSEDPLLTDEDRSEVSVALPEMPPMPDSRSKAFGERELFYRVCCGAKTKLSLSYPLTSDDRDNIRAGYLIELADALNLSEEERKIQTIPRRQFTPAEPILAADIRLRDALSAPRTSPRNADFELEASYANTATDPLAGVKINELRDALRCPFLSVARRHLNLDPRRSQTRWWRLHDLPRRAEMARLGPAAELHDRLQSALEAELEELYSQTPDWEMRLLQAGGGRIVDDWVQREERSRELWPKDPASVQLHVPFGSPMLRNQITPQVRLTGTVPAMSRLGAYKVAHVYESLHWDDKNVSDESYLQFGAYMLAMFDKGVPTAIEVESSGTKRTLYVLEKVGALPSEERIQVVTLTRRGGDRDAKVEFFEKAKASIQIAAANLASGSIRPSPGDHCTRCDFGELCRRSKLFSEIADDEGLESE